MALITATQGISVVQDTNRSPIDAPRAGNTVVLAVGAASVNSALPVDATGKQYPAVILTACATAGTGIACWVAFSTAADAVVAATPPAFLVPAGSALIIGVPAGAISISVIEQTAAGFLSVMGIL